MSALAKLEDWIPKQRKVCPEATWMELQHIDVSEQRCPVQRWPLSKDLGSTLDEMWMMAEQYAKTARSIQSFCAALLNAEGKMVAQHAFLVAPDASVGGAMGFGSEPPSLEGITKQLMRHTEAHARMSASSVQGVIDRLLRENERLSRRCETLEERHLQTLQLQEELISLRAERELQKAAAERAEGRKDELVKKAGLLLPAIASKFTGSGMVTDPSIKALAQSLDGEQVQHIAQALKPEQLLVLAQMMQRHGAVQDDEPEGASSA